MYRVKNILYIVIIFSSFILCQISHEKLYITIQMMDQVGVINTVDYEYDLTIETNMQSNNSSMCMDYTSEMECSMSNNCEWMMDMCMESSDNCMDYTSEMECSISNNCEWMMDMCMDSMDNNTIDTPHFIVMDENLGYWFVSTIASGYIAQYSLVDNELIDSYFVGDAPAILTIDTNRKKIYCSRMMPMNGMGNMMPNGESNIIQALNYSHMGLALSEISEYEINSPAPHGLAISSNGNSLFTASNTSDWLYKIDVESGQIIGESMEDLSIPSDQTIQRLKPIQCLVVGSKLFVTCSAGPWYDPFTGQTTIIPGMLQLWDTQTMTLIDSIELGEYSSPWHIKESPVDNLVYVSLAGDNLYDTGGLACVRYSDTGEMQIEWINSGVAFDTPHGVDVSSEGDKIYVSDRGNGNIYRFNSDGQNFDTLFIGNMSMLGGISITKKSLPDLGDTNFDNIINVVDIINLVNTILNNAMLDPYPYYASDINLDNIINVIDITEVINIIID